MVTETDLGKTYYVGECTAGGVLSQSGETADGTIYNATYANGNAVTVTGGAGSLTFENVYSELPNGFYYDAELTITKKLVDVNNKATKSCETFYAGIFSDAACTTLSDKVSENIVALSLAGASEVSQTVRVMVEEGEEVTLYVTEVDENGTPVSEDDTFAYTVDIENATVTLNASKLEDTVVITNGETETETEEETETSNSSQSESTTSGVKTTGVKTGDNSPIALYLLLLLAAVAVLTAGVVYRRRRGKDNN